MGGRYWITGAQLGLLMAKSKEHPRMELLNEIIDDQFIGYIGDKFVDDLMLELKSKEKGE